MDRARRIRELWSWLPAFRVVAETEHLPTAARSLRLSASALSRSVTLLEDSLGIALFERGHRRIRLNAAGSTLLAAVRDAMRRVDDGIAEVADGSPDRVRVAGAAPWVRHLVVPVAGVATVEHTEVGPGDVARALLRGEIDLALLGDAGPPVDGVEVDELGPVRWAVCHARRASPTRFAVASELADPWPSHLPREVALRVHRLEAVLDACIAGSVRAVLPVVLAQVAALRVLQLPRIAPSHLYVARRRPIAPSPLDEVARALKVRATSILGQVGRRL